MTPQELIEKCKRNQAQAGKEDALVTLMVPGKWGKSEYKQLWRGGPRGKIVAASSGHVTAMFKANEVISGVENMLKRGQENEQ